MATNLRLDPEAAAALRAAAARTGRTQAQLLREAVDRFLGRHGTERDRGAASGLVEQPTPFVDAEPTMHLEAGLTTLDLLDRDER